MEFIDFFRDKSVEKNKIVHPFVDTNYTFKYLYCFGLGVLACGHMKAITELKQAFHMILENIQLSEQYQERIMIDINNNFDYKINHVFEILDTKEKQYIFAADLYFLSSMSLWSQSYCEKVIEIYMNIFQLSKEERRFFEQFVTASKKNNLEQARSIYNEFVKNGYSINYKLLKYMCNNFILEERYGDMVLEKGEVLLIDKPTTIVGDILVRNGSSLTIDGGELRIGGNILVDGGRILIKHAKINVASSSYQSFIKVTNTALVLIEDSIIDCNFNCSIIEQEMGNLIIRDSKLLHCKMSYGIEFKGQTVTITNTNIEDCISGGIRVLGDSVLNIEHCGFYNCESDHGGAIYFDSMYDARIKNTIFKNCRAKYIGGAVYFTNKKYGQDINNCETVQCIPEENVIFNYFSDEKSSH